MCLRGHWRFHKLFWGRLEGRVIFFLSLQDVCVVFLVGECRGTTTINKFINWVIGYYSCLQVNALCLLSTVGRNAGFRGTPAWLRIIDPPACPLNFVTYGSVLVAYLQLWHPYLLMNDKLETSACKPQFLWPWGQGNWGGGSCKVVHMAKCMCYYLQ